MIKTWLVSGDTHGQTDRFSHFKSYPHPEEVAMIILGDSGFNYNLDFNDDNRKAAASKYGGYIYCVRGNHDERPENVPGMKKVWDDNVVGYVYMEDDFPLIRYFIDGNEYFIDGKITMIIGGAYSVDKKYRIARGWKWFPGEQLTEEEKIDISKKMRGRHYDLVLAHTCPFSWQPFDLFMSGIDQSTVDTSMEEWLEELKDTFTFGLFLFGHYHDDRIVRPKVEMLYRNIENLSELFEKWKHPEYIQTSYKFDL